MNKKQLTFLFAVTILLSIPAKIFACACCSEPGQYSIRVTKPAVYQLEMFKEINFSNKVELFVTPAGTEIIKGLGDVANSYSLFDGAFETNKWTLNFKDDKGKPGSLSLPQPATVLEFKADIHDKKEGDPVLYKEFRFQGNVATASGFFKNGFVPAATKYFFVLQGRGNNCDNAEDFTHWRVEITSKKSNFAFFGELKNPVNNQ